MTKHIDYPEIPLAATDLRVRLVGPTTGYVISTNDVDDLVEVWIDFEIPKADVEAVANLRLLPEDARRLAEQLLISAERIERTYF